MGLSQLPWPTSHENGELHTKGLVFGISHFRDIYICLFENRCYALTYVKLSSSSLDLPPNGDEFIFGQLHNAFISLYDYSKYYSCVR